MILTMWTQAVVTEYAKYQNRIVQKLALESNKMMAESYSFCHIDENRIRLFMRQLFDSMGIQQHLWIQEMSMC